MPLPQPPVSELNPCPGTSGSATEIELRSSASYHYPGHTFRSRRLRRGRSGPDICRNLSAAEAHHDIEAIRSMLVGQNEEQAALVAEFDEQSQEMLRPRLLVGRECAVHDEDVGPLDEAADEIDRRPLLSVQQPSRRPNLVIEPDPLRRVPEAQFDH